MRRLVTPILFALLLTASERGAAEYRVPPTGQTKSVTAGDDGAVQAGGKFRYRDNGDGTISDLSTGLVWEKKCDNCDPLHSVHTRIGWTTDGPDSIPGWLALINAEGSTGFAGRNDWRLPTLRELHGIVDYGRSTIGRVRGKSIDASFGPTSASGGYVTSTTVAGNPKELWIVQFATGGMETGSGAAYVRAVRGPAPASAPLTDNGDGTVTDPNTGLMWEQKCERCGGLHDVNGQIGWDPEKAESIWSWIEQVNREDRKGYAGYSDWRIPNIKELASIVDYTRGESDRALPIDPIMGPTRSWYWSSTFMDRDPPFVWTVKNTGGVDDVGMRGNQLHVRAVRTARKRDRPRKLLKKADEAKREVVSPFPCAIPDGRIDLSVTSPAIAALRASMAERWETLAYLQIMGVIEVAADLNIKLRSTDGLSRKPSERDKMRDLVAQENRDRTAFYGAIARANRLPKDSGARAVQQLLATTCIVTDRYSDQRRGRGGTRLYSGVMLGRPLRPSQQFAVALIGARDVPLQGGSLGAHAVDIAAEQPVRWEVDPAFADVVGERGSTLGYLYLSDERLLNAELIRAGLAYADPDPALRHHAALIAAQDEAQQQARGVWAARKLRSDPQAGAAGPASNATCDEWRGAPNLRMASGETINLLGIRTVAGNESIAREACTFVLQWLDNQSVRVEIDPAMDRKHAMAAAYVLAPDGSSVSAALLRQGLVQLDPADMQRGLQRSAELLAAEREAREQRRGIWATNPVVGLEEHQTCPLGFAADGHARCHVFRLTNGDTVGLLGMRLPAWADYQNKEAAAEAGRMVSGQTIRQEFDPAVTDRYGCALAYVFLADGTFVNAELVRRGYARAEPDENGQRLRHAEVLIAAEQEAKTAMRGVWAGPIVTGVWVAGHPFYNLQRGGQVSLTGVRTPNLGDANQKGLVALLKPMAIGKPLQVAAEPRLAALGVHAGSYATLGDGSSLNVAVVREGFGYTESLGRPYDLEEPLRQAEQEARAHQRGLWAPHPVLGVSIQGYVALLLLRNGDARFDPPYITAQLLGIEPWIGHAEQTGTFISKLTTDKIVRLEFDAALPEDPILTPVYAHFPDGTLLNAEIVRQGYAQVDKRSTTLKLRYAKELDEAAAEAKANRRGMWAEAQ